MDWSSASDVLEKSEVKFHLELAKQKGNVFVGFGSDCLVCQ